MTVKVVNTNFNEKLWNKLAPHPLQSWSWGEARMKMGIEVLRLIDEKNVYQVTFHKIPFTPYKIGYLPRSVFPSKDVLTFLAKYGRKNNVVFIKIEPYERMADIKDQISKKNIKNHNLIKSKHPLFPSWTQILDISKSEDELLKNMHPKTRYNIRLAQKKGVKVIEMSTDEGFKIFSKLYFETCRRQKYFGHHYQYHKIVWDNLKNHIAHILIAFYKTTPLAAYELFYFKNTLYYPYGGTSVYYRNLMASNLLMWEAIRFGKKLGAKEFDMWGSLPPNYDKNHPWAGFTRFKEGYGGKFIQMIGSYDLILNEFLYRLYNLSHSLRNLYLSFVRLV